MVLETKRLLLREMKPDDFQALFRVLGDPEMLAFAYTAPISALIHLCSREPEKTDDAIAQIEAFSRHFIRVYGQ